MSDPYRSIAAPDGIMGQTNYGVAPFHPAFDNYEFTMAVGETFDEELPLEAVLLAMSIRASGNDSFLVLDNPRPQEHDSLEDTLLPHNHDPLEREAQAERDANIRADLEESTARACTAESRARADRDAGIQEPWDSPCEDAAGIAEGEAISFAEYGSRADLYENSCLAEPEFIPAGTPTRPCRYDTMRGVQRFGLPNRTELEQEAAEEAAEWARRHRLEVRADAAYKKLRDTQSEQKGTFKTLLDLVS